MLNKNIWIIISRIIIKGRIPVLFFVVLVTILFSTQWKKNRFTFSEAELLPKENSVRKEYERFKEKFGDEGNLILIGVNDSLFNDVDATQKWHTLNHKINQSEEVGLMLSTASLRLLKKNQKDNRFEIETLDYGNAIDRSNIDSLKHMLYNDLPFYNKLIYNSEKSALQSLVFLKKDIVNTNIRRDFILDKINPWIEAFEQETKMDVHISGMPYIRTMNTKIILSEIIFFIAVALIVTALIFFLFFRSFRATFISMIVVIIGEMWAFGVLGLFGYKITLLTALVPPLLIVIGIPNCIFLINKYQQEVKKHGNQARSLQRVISRVGNATLMTNLTTAAGFATFIITDSKFLSEFGVMASINIGLVFLLSLIIIPAIYSFMPLPKKKHLKHLNNKTINALIKWMEYVVRHHRIAVYCVSLVILVLSIVGIYQVQTSASLLDDVPPNADFSRDIHYFEDSFEGILPLEIMIDTKKKNGVTRWSNLNRIEEVEDRIENTLKIGMPFSITRLVKYLKQAFYNGNPRYYELPTSQESNFIMSYLNNENIEAIEIADNFTDSLGTTARITTYIKDRDVVHLDKIVEDLDRELKRKFPIERYDTTITGKSLTFFVGTQHLIKNLFLSLALAILVVLGLMAYMFRSFKMIVISLLPNVLPLLMTAGLMGFLNIPLKPSTILVFSIAFGISVDDTLHFLAKYRQELQLNNWKITKSVYIALRETGVSMLYTSVVLFFGFSIFMLSSFGGTIALGGLVSSTLLFAMLANLILLPSLLLSLEKNISNKKTFKKPNIDILSNGND